MYVLNLLWFRTKENSTNTSETTALQNWVSKSTIRIS